MMFVKSDKDMEAGVMPDPKQFVEMNKYNEELKKAGVLISLDGLHASSDGVRVNFDGGKITTVNGPFSHPNELVAGYWLIETDSLQKAVDFAKRVPFDRGVIEIRQIQEMSDFPPEIQKVLN